MDDLHDAPRRQPHAQETYPLLYPWDELMRNNPTNNMASSSWNSPNLGTLDDMSQLESGLYRKQETYPIPIGYPWDERMINIPTNNMASRSWNSPILGTVDDMAQFESGQYQEQYYGDYYHEYFQAKLGKPVDPRSLPLLKFFKELYVRRRDLFKKVFPRLHDEFVELPKKYGGIVAQFNEVRMGSAPTMRRSLSAGSPRTPSSKGGESPLKLYRFKVRTVKLGGGGGGGGVQQGGQGSQGGQGVNTKSGGSKSKVR